MGMSIAEIFRTKAHSCVDGSRSHESSRQPSKFCGKKFVIHRSQDFYENYTSVSLAVSLLMTIQWFWFVLLPERGNLTATQ